MSAVRVINGLILDASRGLLLTFMNEISSPYQEVIDRTNALGVFARVRHRVQNVAHRIQPRSLLVVGFDNGPWRIRRIGVEEHRLLARV
jgi:hypothetical protein